MSRWLLPAVISQATGASYAPILVQSGSHTYDDLNRKIVIDPVPVGKAFPIVTVRGITQPRRSLLQVQFTDVVDGNYTRLECIVPDVTTNPVIEWQVVSCDDFTVQHHRVANTGTSFTQAITAVDLSKAFLVSYSTGSTSSENAVFARVKFNSTTQLGFLKNAGTSTHTSDVFVVEWEGATVQGVDISSFSGTSTTTSITSVDLTKAFCIFSHSSSGDGENAMLRLDIQDATTLRAAKTGASTHNAHVLVVEHPNLVVQKGLVTLTGTTGDLTVTAVDLTKTFLISPIQGNAHGGGTTPSNYNTHRLTSTTNARVERNGSNTNLLSSIQVVEWK
jgi:hypothetical protein